MNEGEKTLDFIESSVITFPNYPSSFNVTDNTEFIAGYFTSTAADFSEIGLCLYYGINKGADGSWRVSSEIRTPKPPPQAKAITPNKLISELNMIGLSGKSSGAVMDFMNGKLTNEPIAI